MYICDDIVITNGGIQVAGISTFNGVVQVNTGIRPDTDEGAFIGTASLPFSEAHIGEIRIANGGNDNEIDTATGDLTLDSAGGTTRVDDNLIVSGNSNLQGNITAGGNLSVADNLTVTDNVQIGGNLNVDGDTTLDDTDISGTLEVIGSATIDQVTINGDTVTATRFQGKADEADRIRIVNGTSGDQYPVMANNVGQQTLHRDTRLKFNGGTLTVSNDLVAFASDDRLKTNRVGLTDALDKVCSLNGFTFNFNETGGELGFSTDIRYVGVSAQEVQKVLPEAVKPAGADENYITVQYEKIVPLLIEAIKELSDKVSALEDKLNN